MTHPIPRRRRKMVSVFAGLAITLMLISTCSGQIIEEVIEPDRFRLSDGKIVEMVGVDMPHMMDREPMYGAGFHNLMNARYHYLHKSVEIRYDPFHIDGIIRGDTEVRPVYIYMGRDGTSINERMIRRGYGRVSDGPFLKQNKFKLLEEEARNEGSGWWDGTFESP